MTKIHPVVIHSRVPKAGNEGIALEIGGKNIVVTGGASGIGAALCRRFATEGAAHITVVDIDADGSARVASEISGSSRRVDVRSRPEMEELILSVEAERGPIDLFVSNAGIFIEGGASVDVDDWSRIWDVNVMAHVNAAHALIPGMRQRGEGYLLNTCSAAGLLSQIGSAPYAVTKHAAVGFAEWLSITYGNHGIKVSVLCPQAVRTAMSVGIEDGGVAGVDGMMEAEAVAASAVEGLRQEQFLILPHETVGGYYARKGQDIDRWLEGMRRLAERFGGDGI